MVDMVLSEGERKHVKQCYLFWEKQVHLLAEYYILFGKSEKGLIGGLSGQMRG